MKTLKIVCSVMLFIALFNNPYSYYQILKWVISISSIYLANYYFKSNNEVYMWVFIALSVLYNPIAPIHFARDTWEIINVITIGVYLYTYRKHD